MTPSLIEIINAIDGAIGWAEGFAQSHPGHKDAVGTFIKDLQQIDLELRTACMMDPSFRISRQVHTTAILHDIVSSLTIARSYADLISEWQPDYANPLKRFQREVQRVQRVLIKQVHPEL
jgi:hypothetical protein